MHDEGSAGRWRRFPPVIGILLCLSLAGCVPSANGEDQRILRVMMADDWAGAPAVLDVVRAFERAHPGVVVSITPRPFSQIPAAMQTTMSSGNSPDVVQHHAFAAAAIGQTEPLDRWWQDGTFDADAHLPAAMEGVTWDGVRHGVPLDLNAMLVVHDPDLPVPTTFADVVGIADRDPSRPVLALSSDSWEIYGWIRANGGEVVTVSADGTPTFTLDAPEVVEALAFLGELVAAGRAHGPISRNVSSEAYELFSAGDTDLLMTGVWSTVRLDRDHPERDYITAPMPAGPSGRSPTSSALGGSSLFVVRGSEEVDLAVAFMQALTADAVALRLAQEEGRMPTRSALYADLPDSPTLRTLTTQLQTAEPMRLIAFPVAETAFAAAIDAVLTGRSEASSALAEAQRVAVGAHGGPG